MSFIDGDRVAFDEAVKAVQKKYSLGSKWVNTAGTVFESNKQDPYPEPSVTVGNLRLIFVSLPHLLALKLRADRPKDAADIAFILRKLNITDPYKAEEIHNMYFDDSYVGVYPEGEIAYCARDIMIAMSKGLL